MTITGYYEVPDGRVYEHRISASRDGKHELMLLITTQYKHAGAKEIGINDLANWLALRAYGDTMFGITSPPAPSAR